MFEFCFKTKYCNVHTEGDSGVCSADLPDSTVYVKLLNSVDEIVGLDEHDKDTHEFYTIKFVCDRGVSHEYVRHRVFSFAQESTRRETMAA